MNKISRLTDVSGFPVYEHAEAGHVGEWWGDRIVIRPAIAARLTPTSVRAGEPKRRVAVAVFILTHEMGHAHGNVSEDDANTYARKNFKRMAAKLGAPPRRVQELVTALPWSL